MRNKIKILGAVVAAFAIAITMFTVKYEKVEAGGCGGCNCPAKNPDGSPFSCAIGDPCVYGGAGTCPGHSWVNGTGDKVCPICGSTYAEGAPGSYHSIKTTCKTCPAVLDNTWPCGGDVPIAEPPKYSVTLIANHSNAQINGKDQIKYSDITGQFTQYVPAPQPKSGSYVEYTRYFIGYFTQPDGECVRVDRTDRFFFFGKFYFF